MSDLKMFGQTQNVCKYEKFGFCKERDSCPRFHPKVLCDKDTCDVTSCSKRHPMPCRNFTKGECRFGNVCKFDHRKQKSFKDLEIKNDNLLKELKHLKSRITDQDATISSLKQMIENLQLRFNNQEKTVNVMKADLKTTEETLVGLMRHVQEESQLESTPAKKRRKSCMTDLDSEAETTMGEETSLMELDELAMTDLSYAEKMQTDNPNTNYADNEYLARVLSNVRYMYKMLNKTKIQETYERIALLKEDIEEEYEYKTQVIDTKVLDNVSKIINSYFQKINPRNKKSFRTIAKEMFEEILKAEDDVHKKMTGKK